MLAAATGNIGIKAYSGSVELLPVRLKNLSWLIAVHAYIQLLAALICFTIACKRYTITSTKVPLSVVSFDNLWTMLHFNSVIK